MTATAHPMSYSAMRNNARFLTDRMAYTLGLSTALLDDLYYINYDYICGVNDYLDDVALGYYYDDYMAVVRERDYALQRLLTPAQWAMLLTYDYFYRPISFVDRAWRFALYAFDHRPNYYYYRVPRHFNSYRGGHHFHGMRPSVHRPSRPHSNRPSFRIERHGANGGNVGRPGNSGGGSNRPNGNRVDRPGNGGGTSGRPSGTPNVGGNERPSNGNTNSVRPDGGGSNRGDRVTGSGRGGSRSESNMRSSSRAGSRSSVTRSGGSGASRNSSSVGRSSSRSSDNRSSVSRSGGSRVSRGSATRGGSGRGGRR